jgi:uncharacterized protein YeaO (DUF488 family)/DNA-binding MarR family transcriptional regulator
MTLPDSAYARLLALRTGLRHFERWSERQAQAAGLTPAQHQLLLAIRGHGDPDGPTIGEVADYLLLRHHSAVGLVDRAESAGLVDRARSEDDHRVVKLHLTVDGAARLEAPSALHLEELHRLALDVPSVWAGLEPVYPAHGFARPSDTAGAPGRDGPDVEIARVSDETDPSARRVLVDRAWPRGVARQPAPFDEWPKAVAPSVQLRTWYGHAPERFAEFARRYREELCRDPADAALSGLRSRTRVQKVVLVTATRDLDRSGAAVLRDVLAER